MNLQTVADQIIQIIEYIGQKMGIAITWTADNILPILETLCGKYITWEIATSIAWIILCLIPIIVTIFWHKNYRKRMKESSYYWDFDCCAEPWLLTILTILACLCIIPIYVQIFDIVKCIAFPELQIFQFVKGMLSTPTVN